MSYRAIARRGFMLVLSSPSGAGKSTICNEILKIDDNSTVSVSVTTRPKRPGEVEGKDYFFISRDRYREMLTNHELLEHAEVFDNGYGTPKQFVFEAMSAGKDIIFDIDWQGTQQLAQLARTDLVSIFILPPSIVELESRLRNRAQDGEEVIRNRMSEANHEISHWAEYDYVIVNNNLEESVNQVRAIMIAERLRRTRQIGLIDFVNQLRSVG